jgi:hypothetical protein
MVSNQPNISPSKKFANRMVQHKRYTSFIPKIDRKKIIRQIMASTRLANGIITIPNTYKKVLMKSLSPYIIYLNLKQKTNKLTTEIAKMEIILPGM